MNRWAMDLGSILLGLTVLSALGYGLDLWRRRRRPANEAVPAWAEWSRSLFPMLLAVLMVRSFIAEPFRIPSASMVPTNQVGDFILVNKMAYGLRLSGLDTTLVSTGHPHRGDVVVFRFPGMPCPTANGQLVRSGDLTCVYPNTPVGRDNWIKRVIGVPGDRIEMVGDTLSINGQVVQATLDGPYQGNPALPDDALLMGQHATRWTEHLPTETGGLLSHPILRMTPLGQVPDLPNLQVPQVIPKGCYLVMGDDRYDSIDSRWWGCVPEANLVGKAVFTWFSFVGAAGGWVDRSRLFHAIQ